MKVYRTSEVAKLIGIHPNTVRMYEKWGLLPTIERKENGYRIYTDFHIAQLKLARLALSVEILQNDLRKKIIQVIKLSANKEFDKAILYIKDYLNQIKKEIGKAEEAIHLVKQIIQREKTIISPVPLKRKEVSMLLDISIDTLRNWELNGLIKIKRKKNGYRIYNNEDIKRIKIIRVLRCANYSLDSILRMLNKLSQNPDTDIKNILNTPNPESDIISVCDNLIISLEKAEENGKKVLDILHSMKDTY